MFVPVRLLEMGFSMRHIYKAMEAAGILQKLDPIFYSHLWYTD
uniref:Uncharacterized protein n=1 Tax=Anguilla anguilla TaxID=7936 RepID=A0A0E9VQC1_ANGAN